VALGRRFEAAAARYLREAGYRILAQNLRHGHREVDLVVERNGVVAFVEVKGRTGDGCGHPLEAVTHRKRREVEAVARWWIRQRPPALGYRFDAVSVEARGLDGRTWGITHLPDAWRPGDLG
jgi:putative endonuclease